MRAVVTSAGIAVAVLAALAVWQLGDDESADTAAQPPPPPETADPLPTLPRHWTPHVNEGGGFAVGVPPGWSVKDAAAQTTLRSPGSAVAVRITADRTNEALEADLGELAAAIAEAIEPGGEPARLRPPAKLVAGYEAAGVRAAARLEVFVVRRAGLAAYPVLVASGEGVGRRQLDPIVRRLIRSLRGRPIGPIG